MEIKNGTFVCIVATIGMKLVYAYSLNTNIAPSRYGNKVVRDGSLPSRLFKIIFIFIPFKKLNVMGEYEKFSYPPPPSPF